LHTHFSFFAFSRFGEHEQSVHFRIAANLGRVLLPKVLLAEPDGHGGASLRMFQLQAAKAGAAFIAAGFPCLARFYMEVQK